MTDGTTRRYNDGESSPVCSAGAVDAGGEGPELSRDVSAGDERVARRPPHGISGSQVFTWRRLMNQGRDRRRQPARRCLPGLRVPALEAQVRELQRLLGKKAWRMNCCVRPCPGRRPQKTAHALDLVAGGRSVTAVADALGISHPHLSAMRNRPTRHDRAGDHHCRMPSWSPISGCSSPICRPMAIVVSMPYCAAKPRRPGAQRPIPSGVRRHESAWPDAPARRRTARGTPSRRPRRRRPAQHPLVFGRAGDCPATTARRSVSPFALDCCDREAIGHVATTGGITAEDVQT